MNKLCKNCMNNNIVHKFQDSTFGKYVRVHNQTSKAYRCTVCGSIN